MIVIIISLVSASMLMSGGYGLWRKPLMIIGNIEVREKPQPIVVVAPLIPVVSDPNQGAEENLDIPDTVDPDSLNHQETVNPQEPVNQGQESVGSETPTEGGAPTLSTGAEEDEPKGDQSSEAENSAL